MRSISQPAGRRMFRRSLAARAYGGGELMVRLRTVQIGTIEAWALTVLFMLTLASPTVLGQSSTTATLRGNVQDSSGAVLPGSTVTLTSTGTKTPQTTVTDGRGQYLFAAVFPGAYELKVELAGFKTYE